MWLSKQANISRSVIILDDNKEKKLYIQTFYRTINLYKLRGFQSFKKKAKKKALIR